MPEFSSKAPSPFRFLDLPGELRNYVYELLVDRGPFKASVFAKLPRITQVCRQLRKESMVIFLGRNEFYVNHASENIDYLVHWLDAIGRENLPYLRLLSIECTKCLARVDDKMLEYHGAFRRWHELVACLTAFGLRPSQLQWHWGPNIDLPKSHPWVFYTTVNVHFFAKYTLEPLLADHDLLHKTSLLFDIISDIAAVEDSERADQATKDYAGYTVSRMEWLEDEFVYNQSPQNTYEEYLQNIFDEAPDMLGRFYDLKYLHKRSGALRYKESYQDSEHLATAVQSAVDLHRHRHQNKRQWTAESNILGARSLYDAHGSEIRPGNFLYSRAPAAWQFSFPAQKPQSSNGSNATFSKNAAPSTPKFGFAGSMSKPMTDPNAENATPKGFPFIYATTISESPFANLQATGYQQQSPKFAAGFSTKPARTPSTESKSETKESGLKGIPWDFRKG